MKERKALTCLIGVPEGRGERNLGRGKVEQNWGKPATKDLLEGQEIQCRIN